ncbi:MAG: hypothetical protein M1830_006449 [Pleopsidium flavum]|nr:MAG: hypothetical protein M1830_006449 [Pleopsidium flavum]
MLATRAAKPKLSLSINAASRPSLSLKSPMPRTPISPSPISPTARNTRLNQRGFSTAQQPSYAYAQSSSTKSILKKGLKPSAAPTRRIQFRDEPVVYSITPVEQGEDYYGRYIPMSKDEKRWGRGYDG